MDPQIEIAYGDAGWVFDRYADEVSQIRVAGDCIGLHVHTWRPTRRWFRDTWIADFEDEDWIEEVLKLGLETFKTRTGSSPVHMSFGDGFMHHAALPLMQEYGVRADCSMNPGRPAIAAEGKGEISKGKTPDYTRTPRHPFKPSQADFTVPGPTNYGFWEIPVTTGNVKDIKTGQDKRTKLLLGMFTEQAEAIISQALTRNDPYILGECRTDVMTNDDNRARFIGTFDYLEKITAQQGLVFSKFETLCDQLDANKELGQ